MLRLGSRGSALARWQAEEVRRRLGERGHACEIEIIQTTGDRRTDVSLAEIGGKGLFTEEIEAALVEGRIDLAVHSLKDVPTVVPPGLTLAAMLQREDARDALVAVPGTSLAGLPAGARVGTSSLRRQAQGRELRPDLEFVPVRGNVDTRLRRWREGDFDALLLAAAGLKRLGLESAISEWLDTERFCPAAGQGVLALECRAEDAATQAIARELNHPVTGAAVRAERALLARLECGCQAPVGAFAQAAGRGMRLSAVVASADGRQVVRRQGTCDSMDADEAAALGLRVAEDLLQGGGAGILGAIYG